MDYEKKYNELIEAIKELRDLNTSDEGIQNWVHDNFPELKESEDDKNKRISEEIIRFLKQNNGWNREWIAWLEKMSGLKYSIFDKLIEADNIYQISMNDAMTEEAKNKAIEALSNLEVSKLLGIEKQCEQPKEFTYCYEVEVGNGNTKGLMTGKIQLPKFKVGELIKYNNLNVIYKVISVNNGSYYVENIETGGRLELFNAEQNFHLWTIQDAKDGDVLVTTFDEDNMIVMYHSMCTTDTINVHCCLDNKFVCWNIGVFDAEDVKPATKEQRDILFSKMHEVGYEWDAEKK